MENQLLNLQADKIEMVLSAHRAPARVWGGRLTPRAIQFHLAPAMNTKLYKLHGLTEEVALALGVLLTGLDVLIVLLLQHRGFRLLALGQGAPQVQ